MFELKNLRKEKKNGWTYLKCDIDVTEMENPFIENIMWIAVEEKNEDMLTDDVYDAFALVPLYLGMFYKQDVHIKGNMSPKLYHNINRYIMKIVDNFSKYTHPINFTVDGFKVAKTKGDGLVGTGISCGVDSFTTIYDNYIVEKQKGFKIDSLFFVNFEENEETKQLWFDRIESNKRAADELGLPMYLVDSNFGDFIRKVGVDKAGCFAIYSCFLALQKYIKRYFTASATSYDEASKYSLISRDVDMFSYAESYLAHLISTERFELIIDGCQYTRAEKIKRICDWDITKKYLSVCISPKEHAKNCSWCQKCMRTLMVLDVLGKLDDYKEIFDIETYKKKKLYYKYYLLATEKENGQNAGLVEYLKKNKVKFPSKIFIKTKFKILHSLADLMKINKKMKQSR